MKWNVTKLHDHCKSCAELAATAIEHCLKTDATVGSSSYMDGVGESARVLHHARVELKPGFVETSRLE
jgi:hypothetical protein